MRLIYCYIGEFRNIENQGFNFSLDYECSFERNTLKIEKRQLSEGEILLTDPFTRNLSIIVGKTGSGKTNLLQLIGMTEMMRSKNAANSKYFLLYEVDAQDNLYAIEMNRILPKGFEKGKRIPFPSMVYFRYSGSRISRDHVKERNEDPKTVIISSFEKDSINKIDFELIHIDGAYTPETFIKRFQFPYGRANAGVACWYAKEYISQFSEECIKHDACLEICSRNWGDELQNELEDELLKNEYWFYYDNWEDKPFKSLRDVPKFFDRNVRDGKDLTAKQRFIHDLLTDYALYLRKWAALVTPITNKTMEFRKYMRIIQDSDIANVHELPDGKCIEDLKTRIKWLCQYIDLHTDEMKGNRGLLDQISRDINDLADIFDSFDQKYFEDGKFVCPIEEIIFEEESFNNLFERMSRYRADQLGAFTKELLPYNITYLSSGEYQYARVLGSVSEFISKGFLTSQSKIYPDNLILLLDEPETFMHPEMCRNFVYWMGRILTEHNKIPNVQVIMSTHSPFMLSDVHPNQIIKIRYDDYGMCHVVENTGEPTFAGDIYSIMANEFFLDYSIGELSKRCLQKILKILKEKEAIAEKSRDDIIQLQLLYSAIPHIGDNIIRESLRHMIEKQLYDTFALSRSEKN